jgi:glycosyltransferase involved in cell wall biosynthesis
LKVSVITVVKNDATGLGITYANLVEQSLIDWEMIIVVGESTDNTLGLATEIQSKDLRVRLIKQLGQGIYQAMNDGLGATSGEFTWFMNAGDRFATKDVLSHALVEISQSDAAIVIGGYRINNDVNGRVYSFPTKIVTAVEFAFTRRGGCHQAMIFSTKVLRFVGGFDTSFSLASDFDLVLRVIKVARVVRVSKVYAVIEPGGRADQGIHVVHREKHKIRTITLGGPLIFLLSLIWTLLARLKISMRRFIMNSL